MSCHCSMRCPCTTSGTCRSRTRSRLRFHCIGSCRRRSRDHSLLGDSRTCQPTLTGYRPSSPSCSCCCSTRRRHSSLSRTHSCSCRPCPAPCRRRTRCRCSTPSPCRSRCRRAGSCTSSNSSRRCRCRCRTRSRGRCPPHGWNTRQGSRRCRSDRPRCTQTHSTRHRYRTPSDIDWSPCTSGRWPSWACRRCQRNSGCSCTASHSCTWCSNWRRCRRSRHTRRASKAYTSASASSAGPRCTCLRCTTTSRSRCPQVGSRLRDSWGRCPCTAQARRTRQPRSGR